jgi:hypothetical protein
MLAGTGAAQTVTGSVVLVIEQADALPAMLHTAERLVDGTDTSIVILLVDRERDTGPDLGQTLDSQVRLAMSERPTMTRTDGTPVAVRFMTLPETFGDPAALAEALRRLAPGFLIARFGGLIVSPEQSLRPLGAVLCCPLLLIR